MKSIHLGLAILTMFIFMNARGQIIKAPRASLDNLDSFKYQTHYLQIEPGLEMAYIDEGKKEDPIVLLLHGEPNWSFVYRNIIPVLVENGYRVVAPDLIGFGRSDKFENAQSYTYSNQTKWLKSFLSDLNLSEINLFAHDWGGMIVLRIIAERPELFSKVIISYAFLFTGEEEIPESFGQWKDFALNNPDFKPGQVMNWGSNKDLPEEIIHTYNLPFPDEKHMLAVRKYPSLIPMDPSDEEALINKKRRAQLRSFDKPFLTVWGDNEDKMWKDKDSILQLEVPGAKNLDHKKLKANHFIQEDQPAALAKLMVAFFIE